MLCGHLELARRYQGDKLRAGGEKRAGAVAEGVHALAGFKQGKRPRLGFAAGASHRPAAIDSPLLQLGHPSPTAVSGTLPA